MDHDFPLKLVKVNIRYDEILQNLDQNFNAFIDDFTNKSQSSKEEFDIKYEKIQKKLAKLNDAASIKIDEVFFNGLNDILEERNLKKLSEYLDMDPSIAFNGKYIPSQSTLLSFIQQIAILLNNISDKQIILKSFSWLEVVFDNLDDTDPIIQCFLNPVLDTLLPSIKKLSSEHPKALLIHHYIRNFKNQ